MVRSHALLMMSIFALSACAGAPESRVGEAEDEAALTTRSAGAKAFLAAVRAEATPRFVACRTRDGVSPRFELNVDSRDQAGPARVSFRQATAGGVMSEHSVEGTLDGIPRAGNLQGTIAFSLGSERVSFDYFVEQADEANELTFRGKSIPLLCNAR